MRNAADVTGGKPIAVLLQSISGVSAINPLVAFYDIHGRKGEVLFFCSVSDTTRDSRTPHDTIKLSLYIMFYEIFRYLGSLIQNDGEINRDVKKRMNEGWMKWRQDSGTTCDQRMPLKLKGKIYKTIIRPVVLYGSECWATKVRESRLHVTEMRMFIWICVVTRVDRIRNEYIRGSLKVAPVTEKMRSNGFAWYEHVMQRDESHIIKRVMTE
jgi:hypothetical protein